MACVCHTAAHQELRVLPSGFGGQQAGPSEFPSAIHLGNVARMSHFVRGLRLDYSAKRKLFSFPQPFDYLNHTLNRNVEY